MMTTLRMAITEHPAAGPLAVRAYADPIVSGHRAEVGSKAYSLQLRHLAAVRNTLFLAPWMRFLSRSLPHDCSNPARAI
jgi:hypothetical protein